jgi:hypothetical protein
MAIAVGRLLYMIFQDLEAMAALRGDVLAAIIIMDEQAST